MTHRDEIQLNEQDEEFHFLFKESRASAPETPESPESAPEATIQGDLANLDLSDMFQTISMSNMTGTLVIHTGARETAVHFQSGQIRVAPPLEHWLRRISKRLVAARMVAVSDLRAALVHITRSKQPLVECLDERGLLDRDRFFAIQQALEEDTLLELFTNRQGECCFYRDSYYHERYEARFADSLPFEAEQLLFEVARKSDEWGRILEELGTLSEIFMPTQPYNESGCSELEVELLQHLDGTQTLSDVAGAMLDSLFDVAKAAQSLRLKGRIGKVSTSHILGLVRAEVSAQHPERAASFLALIQELRSPNNPEDWEEIASVYVELSKQRFAASALDHAASLTDSREKRKELLREAHRLDSLNVSVLERLHDVLVDEQSDGITDEYGRVVEKLASCYESSDEYDRALDLLEELSEHDPRSAALAGRRARMLVKLNRKSEALQLLGLIAESMKLEKQMAGYGHVLEQIIKIDPNDAAARKELHRIRSRIDPRLVRAGIGLAVALLVGSVGWSYYSAYTRDQATEEALAQTAALMKSEHYDQAERTVRPFLEQYSDETELGLEARALLGEILIIRRKKQQAILEKEKETLHGGLGKAADYFENSQWKDSLETFVELSGGIGKKKPDYAKKITAAVQGRFNVLAEEIEAHLLEHQRYPLPLEEELSSPLRRQEALAFLDEHYPEDRCTAYTALQDALAAHEEFRKLEGLPKALPEKSAKWSRIAIQALDLRRKLVESLRNDKLKVGIDSAFSDAEKKRHEFDFLGALELYEQVVEHYSGDPKLELRFKAQRDKLRRTVQLLDEIREHGRLGEYALAFKRLAKLQQIFPDLDFEAHVALPLTIRSRPDGARILLDGEEQGRTPCTLQLTPDRDRKLAFELEGYRSVKRDLAALHGGEVSISLELEDAWDRPIDGAVLHPPLLIQTRDLAVVTDRSGRVAAHRLSDGKLRWSKRYSDLSGELGAPLLVGSSILLPGRDGKVRRLELDKGAELWTTQLEGPLLATAVSINKEFWVAAESGHVHRLSMVRGELLGSFELGQPITEGLKSDPAGRVFVAGKRGRILAFDAAGQRIWEQSISESGLIPITACESALLVPTGLGKLIVLDPESGERLRELEIGDTLGFGVESDGELVVAANGARKLQLWELRSGRRIWSQDIEALPSAAPTLHEGQVFIPIQGKGVTAYRSESGEECFRMAVQATIEARPAGNSTHLLIAGDRGRIRAYPASAWEQR
jgi:outer membrane protein assembly factor BamB